MKRPFGIRGRHRHDDFVGGAMKVVMGCSAAGTALLDWAWTNHGCGRNSDNGQQALEDETKALCMDLDILYLFPVRRL